jgi:hypothetical protein
MGVRKWHLKRAEHHKNASDYMLSQFDDWALVALFYSAMHYVHSSLADEQNLNKDERNPRKHSGVEWGSRGTNQLVRALYPQIHPQYMSLFEISRRTRYDIAQLGSTAIPLFTKQWKDIKQFCEGLNQGRPYIPRQAN